MQPGMQFALTMSGIDHKMLFSAPQQAPVPLPIKLVTKRYNRYGSTVCKQSSSAVCADTGYAGVYWARGAIFRWQP